MNKIGFLLPRSTFYDTIGFDLFEGLKLGLQQLGRDDVKIVTENIGFGADKQQCYRSAEKLLLEENVNLVIAYIGHRTAELLRPLFLAANKMLIVLDSGASLASEWPSCPNIFYLSLHNALGAWMSAKNATKEGYKSGGMVSGYYDGGYLHTYSISKSFEATGGNINFNQVTGYKEDDFTMSPLKNHLMQYPNSALLSLFSGDFVQWYFREIKKEFEGENLPIYLSPFGLEETMLQNAVYPSNKIKGVTSWSTKIENEKNKLFLTTLESLGKKSNFFSLLGWESAQLAIEIIELSFKHSHKIISIANELQLFEFETPRGKIYFDSKTNTSISPLYEVTVIESNGMCELKLDNQIQNIKEEFEKMCALPLDNVTSAWYNSYTCI
ncbi:ABC transporter substrate-binding protein [Flavobacterium sp. F372]|jgi:branched-chain amino acid transport system substrate-binding protein|uniref:ABC transporter substrate-binding protein n=1 Tax=Flavobacterium bernardetii TaxID=2813823 RepID=A0ABR7J075_9FLAO|nr:ABC transporter substrate-binding protein [Flavobacterium bernardetii]MBC5835264.1 ABC transporter substrate-binding protein [Flavobacterium bernardetii]NHF69609.1 ABC transporter substrate-binding protein [Flavobacterium bernardetii]